MLRVFISVPPPNENSPPDEGPAGDLRADVELILAARQGEQSAMDELYRRHSQAATRFAIGLAGPTLAPDLVAEAFVHVLATMSRGRGPDLSFRSYLYTTIRNGHVDHVRRDWRQVSVGDFDTLEGAFVLNDGSDERFASSAVKRAFESLPERWQVVLWHTAVEGEPVRNVSTYLGLTANAVAALSFRAREGLRLAYLAEHLKDVADTPCMDVCRALPKFIRGALRGESRRHVENHVSECIRCGRAAAELRAISNDEFGALLVPVVLGPVAVSVVTRLAGRAAIGHSAVGSGSAAGSSIGMVAGLVAAGVATVATGGMLVVRPHHEPTPDRPIAVAPAPTSTAWSRSPAPTPILTPTSAREVVVRSTPTLLAPSIPVSLTSLVPAVSQPEPLTPDTTAEPTPDLGVDTFGVTTFGVDPVAEEPVAVSLGTPSWYALAEPDWYHLEVPIKATDNLLRLHVTTSAVADFHVHQHAPYSAWQCRTGPDVAEPDLPAPLILDCELSSAGSTTLVFAFDLKAAEPVVVEAEIVIVDASEPDTADNTARMSIPGVIQLSEPAGREACGPPSQQPASARSRSVAPPRRAVGT